MLGDGGQDCESGDGRSADYVSGKRCVDNESDVLVYVLVLRLTKMDSSWESILVSLKGSQFCPDTPPPLVPWRLQQLHVHTKVN